MGLIEIRTLGPADIFAGKDRDPGPLLAQPKRFAVLCYLALPKPGTLHRRDALLGVFWPDADQDRARMALRQALAHIRRVLGNDVVVRRGAEEVGLNHKLIRCDSTDYQLALEEHRWADAVELYRGEFLEGLTLSNAQEFKHWLDAKRTGFAGRYAFALEELAEAATAGGQTRAAIGWWQSLIRQDPYNSRYGMQLMRALECDGDPANALLFARQHTELLRSEFGIAPPREFEALVEEMRCEHAAKPADDTEAPNRAESDVPGDHLDLARGSAAPFPQLALARNRPKRPAEGWGHTIALGGVAVLLILAGAMGGKFLFDREPELDAQRVIVLPFENLTSDSTLDGLGYLAADWIGQALQQVGMAKVVPVAYARQFIEEVSGTSSNEVARSVADRSGAGIVVCGRIYDLGDSLRYHVEMIDVIRSRSLQNFDSTWPKDSRADAVGDLGQRVSGALAAEFDPYMASRSRLMPSPPTLEAFREHRLGYRFFNRGDFDRSLSYQLSAYALDTTFVRPIVAAGFAARDYAQKDSLSRFANVRRNRLSRAGQLELDILVASIDGDFDAALRAARELARINPGGFSSVNQAVFALNVNRPHEAVEALSQYDPYLDWRRDEADTYWHALTTSLHMLGEHEEELDSARRARELYPDRLDILNLEAQALAALGRLDALEEVLEQVPALTPRSDMGHSQVFFSVGTELWEHGHLDVAQAAFERAIEWLAVQSADDSVRLEHQLALASALYSAQQWEEAYELLEQSVDNSVDTQLHVRYLGTLAAAAARLGNSTYATEISAQLGGMRQPYLLGEHRCWQARIAALLGQPNESLRLLRDAVDEGVGYGLWLGADRDLAVLHGRADFEDFVRPRR
jgi:DNA-binding SARP family transcriptional activator/tetratricopeptide (TPR) repeat protein/TolB-like protein